MSERRSAEIKIELDAATNKVQALLQERRQIADRDREISNLLEDMGLREHEDETMTGCLNDALSDLEDELDEMARMENSWHWPGCPNAVRKERSDA